MLSVWGFRRALRVTSIEQQTDFQKYNIPGLTHFTPGLTLPAIFDGFLRYNQVLHEVARERKTVWVDNANLIPHEDQYFVDRVHFSDQGAKLMAENFFPQVKEIISAME